MVEGTLVLFEGFSGLSTAKGLACNAALAENTMITDRHIMSNAAAVPWDRMYPWDTASCSFMELFVTAQKEVCVRNNIVASMSMQFDSTISLHLV